MKKLILFLIVLLFNGCKIEIPVGVFDYLKNDEVLKPLLEYNKNGILENRDIPMKLNIPGNTKTKVKSYKWVVTNYFGNEVFTSDKEAPVVPGLTAEEYTVTVTISDGNKEKPSERVFEMPFTVTAPELLSELTLIGLSPSCDTGASSTDNVTNQTENLIFQARISESFLNRSGLRLVWRNRDSDSSDSIDIPPSFDIELTINAAGKTFTDGIYECYIEDTANDAVGNKVFVTIDTKAPALSWKIEDGEVQAEWDWGTGASELVNYMLTSADELLYGYTAETNIPDWDKKSFSPYVAGTQIVQNYYGCDLAGNESNKLSRSVTVKDPTPLKEVEDPSFENGNGQLPSDGKWSTNGSLSSAWQALVRTYLWKGYTLTPSWLYIYSNKELDKYQTSPNFQGPWRYNNDKFKNYAYAGVKDTPKTGEKSFWFSEVKSTGGWGHNECWYANTSGCIFQTGFMLEPQVEYRASVWINSGSENAPAAGQNVKLCLVVPAFDENGFLDYKKTEILAKKYTTKFNQYEEVVLSYTPERRYENTAVLIEKDDRGTKDKDNWVHIDDVAMSMISYKKVSDSISAYAEGGAQ